MSAAERRCVPPNKERALPHPLIRKLSLLGDLTPDERGALIAALSPPTMLAANEDIVGDGDQPGRSAVLLGGLACRYKLLSDGRRQILSFQVPGDMVDLHAFAMKRLDHGVCALTRCQVSYISHGQLTALFEDFPKLGLALWRDTLVDSAVFREWMVGLGQRPAFERVAHLLCELAHRLQAAGMGGPRQYPFPLTQALLGDALGLSVVHVNRVMQRLRSDGLIVLSRGVLTILDWAGLKAAGDFDPAYLELPLDAPEGSPLPPVASHPGAA